MLKEIEKIINGTTARIVWEFNTALADKKIVWIVYEKDDIYFEIAFKYLLKKAEKKINYYTSAYLEFKDCELWIMTSSQYGE